MNQLESIYNSPFKDSHSHPIHTHFRIIAGNDYLDFSSHATCDHTCPLLSFENFCYQAKTNGRKTFNARKQYV